MFVTMQITNRQHWKFVVDIHAKTHGHIKIDYAKTHGLATARVSVYQKESKDEENNKINYTIKDKINIKFNIPDKDVIITPTYKKEISNIVNSKTETGMCSTILKIILLISTSLYLIIITRKDYILIKYDDCMMQISL